MSNLNTNSESDAIRESLRRSNQELEAATRARMVAIAEAREAGLTLGEVCEITGLSKPTAIRYTREANGGQA